MGRLTTGDFDVSPVPAGTSTLVNYFVQGVSESEAGVLRSADDVSTTTYVFGDTNGGPVGFALRDINDTIRVTDAFLGSFGDRPGDEPVWLYNTDVIGPAGANCSPARILFVKSKEAKERLKPHLSEGNVAKTMAAPVVAIIGYDQEFYEHLPKLFPHTDARSWFVGKEKHIKETATRNGTLQGAYLIIAARALGLDTGPMSGFDKKGVDAEFFSGTPVRSDFLCNIGYGNGENLFARSPRFAFDEMAEII